MSSNQSIHEDSMLKIITDIISKPGNKLDSLTKRYGAAGPKDTSKVYLKGSISNYANDLVMVFPMICDDSIPPEVVSLIGRANERNIVSMLQILFASAQFNSTDGAEVIRSIYRKPKMDLDDYMNAVQNYVDGNYYMDEYALTKVEEDLVIKEMVAELKRPKKVYSCDAISEKSLSDYSVKIESGSISSVQEVRGNNSSDRYTPFQQTQFDWKKAADGRTYNGKKMSDDPKDRPPGYGPGDFAPNGTPYGYSGFGASIPEHERLDREYKAAQLQNIKGQIDDRNVANMNAIADRDARKAKDAFDTNMDVIQHRLLDVDVKKANELQPTLLVVNYNELDPNKNNEIIGTKTFVAGVKTRIIATDARDIIDRIVAKNKTRLSFVNLIRATTGEIHLVRDFLLCIDQAKIDAKNSVKKGEAANMWKTLEFMSAKNNYNKIRRKGNDASAITTLVISKETANLLKKQYNCDIEKERNANKVIEDYNLLGLFIVDESVEVVKSLYRGNTMFEQNAFSYLEKESNDKSYKKVVNLIGQMNRGY